jgi:hypothetical protein
MGSRSRLFSDGEMDIAALLSPHCFPKPPHAADRHVYHPRLPILERRRSGRVAPSGRRVTRLNKINAAGLSFAMSRAGDANARKPA